ncbi:MAG: ABC transporter ATP-binding protein [Deltaproteobacteria bacterium]|nr:ABC transporter ATP-binding protein [Deltaproteobacteria bacterium]
MSAILTVDNLRVEFVNGERKTVAVAGVSLSLSQGEMLALVGESACGKTTLALALMGLLATPPARISCSGASFLGEPLLLEKTLSLQSLRGKKIAMIFQEPLSSLNPVIAIGEQITEGLRQHLRMEPKAARQRALELLDMVGIDRAEIIFRSYPHQLSGGMRQRVMIAIAFSCHPQVIIADEPTTALDVTVQAQILSLLKKLRTQEGVGFLFITHDLAVVAQEADSAAIMYAGKIVEVGKSKDILLHPLHPYTKGLLASLPITGKDARLPLRLPTIAGTVPRRDGNQPGCAFAPRCSEANAFCEQQTPTLRILDEQHLCACWRYE